MEAMGSFLERNECGMMINSAALVQALRKQAKEKGFKTPPRPCPARRPGNDLKIIFRARLGQMLRRWC